MQVASQHTDYGGGDISASSLPTGLTLTSDGYITGTIDSAADTSSPFTATITSTDNATNVATNENITWTIDPLPTFSIGSQQHRGDTVSVQAFDQSQQTSYGGIFNFTATGLPPGLSLASSGAITGTIWQTADTSSPYEGTITATDPATGLSANVNFNWTVNPPMLTLSNPGDQTNYDGDTVSSLGVVDHSAYGTAGTLSETGLPSGLSMSTDGYITGTISPGDDTSSPYSVTISVSDSTLGTSANETFNWTVTLPTVTVISPGDQNNADGDTINFAVSATDSANHALTFTATGLPAGLSMDSSGNITGTASSSGELTGPHWSLPRPIAWPTSMAAKRLTGT